MTRLMQSNLKWPFVAFIVLETLIFGSGNAITKMAYDSITPLWCLAIRFGLASAVFALFFGKRMVRSLRAAKVRSWLPAAVCMALSYLCCNVALDFTTATNVGFLVALVSSVALAGALVFGKKGLAQLDAITIAGTQIGMAFALCLACAVAFEPIVDVAQVSPMAWGTIAFLALLSTCLTFFLQNVSLEKLPSTTVSLLLTGEPVFTALFSFLLLGETLSFVGLAGAALIVGAVVAATYVEGRQDAKAASAAPAPAAPVSA